MAAAHVSLFSVFFFEALQHKTSFCSLFFNPTTHKKNGRYKGTAGGLVVGISASRDKQVAADTSQLAAGGSHTGAATFTFIQSIEAYGTSLSYEALLRNVECLFFVALFFFLSTTFSRFPLTLFSLLLSFSPLLPPTLFLSSLLPNDR